MVLFPWPSPACLCLITSGHPVPHSSPAREFPGSWVGMSGVTGPGGKWWPHTANSEPWTTGESRLGRQQGISQDFNCDVLVASENDRH